MTFNTGNNVPSTDPRDLYDNAENLDKLVNGVDPFYADRKGVLRESWAGMENTFDTSQTGRENAFALSQADKESRFQAFLVSSGYVSKGDYAANVVLEERNEYVAVDAATTGTSPGLYRPNASATLPLTLTGTWATDAASLVLLGDDALRQELAAPDGVAIVGGAVAAEFLSSPDGAGAVGYRRSVLAASIASVGEWLSAQTVNVWEYANLVTSKPSPNDPTTWDWTPAIQGALDNLPEGGTLQYPSGGTFRHGKVVIPKTVHLVGYGCTLIPLGTEGGYEFAQGVIHDSPSFRGFRVIGDGETVLVGGFFRNFSGATIKGAIFKDMYFSDLSFGIYINQLSAGYHQGAKIINCTFENMIDPSDGTVSGQGLGVAFSGGNDAGRPPLLGLVHGCTFIRCGRHAAYIDSGSSVIFSNNHFIEHRFGKTLQSYPLAALNIGRARHVTAIGNEFVGSIDASLAVAGGAPMGDCRGVTVANNNFHNCYGTMNLRIGSDNPDDNGQVYGVNVTGNTFYHASDNAGAALYIDSAMGLHVRDNLLDATNLTVSNFGLLRIGAFGSSRPSGNYFIEGNTILMPTTGTARAISFNNNVLTGTSRVDIGDNKIIAQAKWVLAVAVTNPNLNLIAYFANGVKSSASGGWNDNPLQLGNYRLWVTSTGKLMMKDSAPISETDGAVVGTQA